VWVNVPLLSQICLFVSLLLILRYVFTVVAIPWGTLLVCVLILSPCCPTDVPICSLSVRPRPQRMDPFLIMIPFSHFKAIRGQPAGSVQPYSLDELASFIVYARCTIETIRLEFQRLQNINFNKARLLPSNQFVNLSPFSFNRSAHGSIDSRVVVGCLCVHFCFWILCAICSW
jgi:hypothetical protein